MTVSIEIPKFYIQISVNILGNSLKTWLQSCRGKYHDKSKEIHFKKFDVNFDVYLAGIDGKFIRNLYLFVIMVVSLKLMLIMIEVLVTAGMNF